MGIPMAKADEEFVEWATYLNGMARLCAEETVYRAELCGCDRNTMIRAVISRLTETMAETTVTDRLAELAELKSGWDSYGGAPPDPLALRMARIITTCTPSINPSGDGCVLLRWHTDGIEMELWLEPGMNRSVIFTCDWQMAEKPLTEGN